MITILCTHYKGDLVYIYNESRLATTSEDWLLEQYNLIYIHTHCLIRLSWFGQQDLYHAPYFSSPSMESN